MLNIHLYPSPLTHESRILKESQAIASFSDFSCIVLVGAAGRGLTDAEMLDEGRTTMRFSRDVPAWLPATIGKVLGVAAWSWRVFRCFSTKPVSCINCHSLSTLPLGVALKFRTGAKLVYDPHELETESNGLGGFRRTIAKVVERAFYSLADEVIVVTTPEPTAITDAYGIIKSIASQAPDKPVIVSPKEGTTPASPMTVTGTAAAKSRVRLTVEYTTVLLGAVPVGGTLSEQTVETAADGTFKSQPVKLQTLLGGKNTTYTITVVAVNANGDESEPVTVTVKGS